MSANVYLPGVIQIPSMMVITNITQAYPMVITFTVSAVTGANTYHVGQLVKLLVPKPWGMFQANGLTARILVIGSSTMALDIDSTNFDAFVDGSASKQIPPSLAPSGARNLEYDNTTRQVPFQSLNNTGN